VFNKLSRQCDANKSLNHESSKKGGKYRKKLTPSGVQAYTLVRTEPLSHCLKIEYNRPTPSLCLWTSFLDSFLLNFGKASKKKCKLQSFAIVLNKQLSNCLSSWKRTSQKGL